MTYEGYLDLPDDGKRYEVVDGELFAKPAPYTRHQRIVGRIYVALDRHFSDHGGGEAFVAPIDVVLSEDSIVQPDVIAVLAARSAFIGERNISGAPDLVVEVLSDGSRRTDEITKRKLYERYGVDEYWIVDPVIDTIKIHRRNGATFVRVAELSTESGGAITSPLLPGFALDVNIVFAA